MEKEQWKIEWHDYYEILQVSPGAEPEVIVAAYKGLAKKYHPDRSSADQARMMLINLASDVLRDPETRSRYDTEFRKRARGTAAGFEEAKRARQAESDARRRAEEARDREERRRRAAEEELAAARRSEWEARSRADDAEQRVGGGGHDHSNASQTATSSGGAESDRGGAESAGESTPTLGGLLGAALIRGLAAILSNSVNARSSGAVAARDPEIGPGRWRFHVATPIPPWTADTILAGGEILLDGSGSLWGEGLLQGAGRRFPCRIGGRWQYDAGTKVLTVDLVLNGMPVPTDRLQIVAGEGGQYQIVSGTGRAFILARGF
jgi:hypothetical protein